MQAMRPPGVSDRVRELWHQEQAARRAQPEWDLRRALTGFVHATAVLAYGDSSHAPLGQLWDAVVLSGRPEQRRTASAGERAALDCVERLRERFVDGPDAPAPGDLLNAADEHLLVETVLVRFTGRALPASALSTAARNAAAALADGAVSAYRAATLVCEAAYYEPDSAPDLTQDLRGLREAYEDVPASRLDVEAAIARRLGEWLIRNPIPES